MQEINYARQESGARSSPIASSEEVAEAVFGRALLASEDKEGESNRREYTCRVCDGPVERPRLVCEACSHRHEKELEWESYLDFMDSDDTAPATPELRAQAGCRRGFPRERPVLVVLCGPSHAGKTTLAQRLRGNYIIISTDEIRKRLSVSFGNPEHEAKVWDIYESLKCKALEKGRNIVLDACHMSKRARWHSLRGPNAYHRKICVVFDLPLRTIRERYLKEKRVSFKEVERMWKDFQKSKPTPEELRSQGFDEVYFVKEWPLAMQSRRILRWHIIHEKQADYQRS